MSISTSRLKQLITDFYTSGEETMLKNHGSAELYEVAEELHRLATDFQKLGAIKAYGRRPEASFGPKDYPVDSRMIDKPCAHCGAMKSDHMAYQSTPNKLRCPVADRVSFYKAAT